VFPIFLGVLNYTEGVDPDILDSQLSSKGDGILECAGQIIEWDAGCEGTDIR
jgi:hypothetical protein